MRPFSYIFDDDSSVTQFDEYFAALDRFSADLPSELREFAVQRSRYTLDGDQTLHDARISELNYVTSVDAEGIASRGLVIRLSQAEGNSEVVLRYGLVRHLDISLQPDKWPNRPVDLLVHEVSIINFATYRHVLQFDRGVWIDVEFSEFSFAQLPVGG